MSRSGERLGIFGGTFDPPHIGHFVAAVSALEALSLDRVLLVVANSPWQKTGRRKITDASVRHEMVVSGVSGVAGLEASDTEICRKGVSYTVDTVEHLQRDDSENHLFLIVGGDAATGLDTWHRSEDLRVMTQGPRLDLVVVDRPGSPLRVVPDGWVGHVVSTPQLDVSSTDLRERVRDGRSIDFLVPNAVSAVITTMGLYLQD